MTHTPQSGRGGSRQLWALAALVAAFLLLATGVGFYLVFTADFDDTGRNNLGVGLITGVATGLAVLGVEWVLNQQRRDIERRQEEGQRVDLVEYATAELARLVQRTARALEPDLYSLLEQLRRVDGYPPRAGRDVHMLWSSVRWISDIDLTDPGWYRDRRILERVDVTLLVASHVLDHDVWGPYDFEPTDSGEDDPSEPSEDRSSAADNPGEGLNDPTPDPNPVLGAGLNSVGGFDDEDDLFEDYDDETVAGPQDHLRRLTLPVAVAANSIKGTANYLSQFRAPARAQRLAHVADNLQLATHTFDLDYAVGKGGVPRLPTYADAGGTLQFTYGTSPMSFTRTLIAYVMDTLRSRFGEHAQKLTDAGAGSRRVIETPSDAEIVRMRWGALVGGSGADENLWRAWHAESSWLRDAIEEGAAQATRSWGVNRIPQFEPDPSEADHRSAPPAPPLG